MATSQAPVAQRELTLTRLFDAPRPLVFSLWTEARHIANWWGPHGFDCPHCEADPRPGGEIVIHMRGPDGATFPMGGFYEEVTPYSRIVFSTFVEAPDGTRLAESFNSVTFTEIGTRTKVSLHVQGTGFTEQAKFMLDGMEAGWATSLDKLAGFAVRENGNPDAADQIALYAILGDRTNGIFGKVAMLAARHLAEDLIFDLLPAPLDGLAGDAPTLQSWFEHWTGTVGWSMTDLTIETSGDQAVAKGSGHLVGARSDLGEVDLQVPITITFARRGGRWLITRQLLSASSDETRRNG